MMEDASWNYDTAADRGLSFKERLMRQPREPDPFISAARFIAALFVRFWLRIYNRFEIIGTENLPHDRSFVIISNHSSHLDAMCLLSALPLRRLDRFHAVAARDYFCEGTIRLVSAAIVANSIFVDRASSKGDALAPCRQVLEKPGNVLIVFPEGTRSTDGSVNRFRRGIAALVAKTGCAVVPCYIDGTFSAWPKGTRIPRPSKVLLTIGAPRSYEIVEPNDAGALMICQDLREAVLELKPKTGPSRAKTDKEFANDQYINLQPRYR